MGFPRKIKDQILADTARHCCVCHRYKGVKVEVHHIEQEALGGSNKYENAQEGYDKGIYTNTQMLEAKLEYSKALFDAKNIMMDYLYSELTLDHLQNSLNASSLRRINTYLAW